MNVKANEFWIVEMLLAPSGRKTRTVVNIYRINEDDGDVGFIMCGDDEVWWQSQFHQLEFVRKVDMY